MSMTVSARIQSVLHRRETSFVRVMVSRRLRLAAVQRLDGVSTYLPVSLQKASTKPPRRSAHSSTRRGLLFRNIGHDRLSPNGKGRPLFRGTRLPRKSRACGQAPVQLIMHNIANFYEKLASRLRIHSVTGLSYHGP